MPDGTRIDINRVNGKVVFTQVTVTQSQVVFWNNNDSEAHWPIQGPRFQIGPGGNSDDSTVYPAPLPTTIYYGCAIQGHENERGSIVVYADFLPSQVKNNILPAGTKGAALSRCSTPFWSTASFTPGPMAARSHGAADPT